MQHRCWSLTAPLVPTASAFWNISSMASGISAAATAYLTDEEIANAVTRGKKIHA